MPLKPLTLPLLILITLLTACGQLLTPTAAAPTPTSPLVTVAFADARPVPTAASIPLPPQPTRTPRPTPTPVIHVIEAGDTLLEIAGRFQVGVDEIMVANPGLRPELLQIGEQIIIPTGGQDGSAGAFLPTPTPLPLAVTGPSLDWTPSGGLWALGEVLNNTETPVEDIQVSVILYDAKGAPIEVMTTWCAREIVPAGESAPFGVLFPRPDAEVVNWRAVLLRAVPFSRPADRYARLTIMQHEGAPVGAAFRVTGTILNQGEVAAEQIRVLATLYDSESRVTAFRQVDLDHPLPPESTASFDIWLAPGARGADHYSVAVSGRAAVSSQ